MSRGIVIYGVNNTMIDYIQLSVMCAALIRKNMPGNAIHLITDEHSLKYHKGKKRWDIGKYFDTWQTLPETTPQFHNKRTYRDTRYYLLDAKFQNETRSMIYNLSPYDETLLVDCDYIIANDVLNCVWGSDQELMINHKAINLLHEPITGNEHRLNPFGIKMYWATVVYFKKGPHAQLLFNLVEHIKDNWDFYRLTYGASGHLYRNDFAFSIALHILNGFVESDYYTTSLPEPELVTSFDFDQLYKVNGPDDFTMFVNDMKDTWKFYATRLKGINFHCMNKISLLNNAEKIMEFVG